MLMNLQLISNCKTCQHTTAPARQTAHSRKTLQKTFDARKLTSSAMENLKVLDKKKKYLRKTIRALISLVSRVMMKLDAHK